MCEGKCGREMGGGEAGADVQIAEHHGAETVKGEWEFGERDRYILNDGLVCLAATINRKRRCAAPENTSREQPAAQNRTP